ncbi:hypothetical protein DL93DRAFT_1885569 [Clavulina sp. PMI_390]|nr:hypothetical protein DL93DRAFT_1885569 [Clavulina sp. PMI_390]
MPRIFSTLLHHLAQYFWPGPPAKMESPIPQILRTDTLLETVVNAIFRDVISTDTVTDGVYTTSPDVYTHYRLRRIAVTRSQQRWGAYHQSLVLEVEDDGPPNTPNNASNFHVLVAERRTSPHDGGSSNSNTRPNPGRNPSKRSLDWTSDYFLPHGAGRDTIRWAYQSSTQKFDFWTNTTYPNCPFPVTDAVTFDFDVEKSGTTARLTLHQVILSMRAVSLVAPKYEFMRENCWWWAQSVLFLLFRLRHQNPTLTDDEIERREDFFRKVNNPSIVTDIPESVGLSVNGRGLIYESAKKAHQNYLDLVVEANASLERHHARARLPAERDAANARADAEALRAEAEAERAEWNAREASRVNQENEALRAQLTKLGVQPFDTMLTTST